MSEYIFPFPSLTTSPRGNELDEVAWCDRLLNVMETFDEVAVKSFLSLTGLKIRCAVSDPERCSLAEFSQSAVDRQYTSILFNVA